MIRESKLSSRSYVGFQSLSVDGVDITKNTSSRPRREVAKPAGFWKKRRIEEVYSDSKKDGPDLQGFTMLFPETENDWIKEQAALYGKGLTLISDIRYKKIQKINQAITEQGIPSHLDLIFINSHVNYGVFLKRESQMIQKGEVIGVYAGEYEIIGSKQKCDTSYIFSFTQEKLKLREQDLDQVTYLEDPNVEDEFFLCINAKEKGNFTRYVNHSSLDPNIEAAFFSMPDGKPVVIFVAVKSIFPGQQLLYNYGGAYWEVHDIIPSDMKPDTFVLDQIGDLRLARSLGQLSDEMAQSLLPLRNFTVQVPNKSLHSIVRRLPVLPPGFVEKLDELEDIVLQRGIPRNLSLIQNGRRYQLSLAQNQPPVVKGSFVGSLTGIVACWNYAKGLLIIETKKAQIYLNQAENGNCFQYIRTNQGDGNLRLELFYNEEEDSLQVVVLAEKRINPGDVLSLIPFEPIQG